MKTGLIRKMPPPQPWSQLPAAWCRYCAGEIYAGEDYYRVDGRAVCSDCLDRLARDYFSLYRTGGDAP